MSINQMGLKMLLFCFVLLIGFAIDVEKGNAVEPTMDGSTVITYSNPWMNKHVKEGLAREWAVSPSTIQDSDLTIANLATIKTFISEKNPIETWGSMKLDGIQYLSGLESFEVYQVSKGEELRLGNYIESQWGFMDLSPFKSGIFEKMKIFSVGNISTMKNGNIVVDVTTNYMIFNKMPNLEVIRINLSYVWSSNNVNQLLEVILKENLQLKKIDISMVDTFITDTFMYNLPDLEEINFENGRISYCSSSSNKTALKLKKIKLNDVQLLLKNPSSFISAPMTTDISLTKVSFTTCSDSSNAYSLEKEIYSPDFFKNMPLLERVFLKKLDFYDLRPFVGLERLEVLSVQSSYVYKVPSGIKASIQDYKYNYIPNQPYQARLVYDNKKQFVKVSDFYKSTTPPYDEKIGYYLPITIETSGAEVVYSREYFNSPYNFSQFRYGFANSMASLKAKNLNITETFTPINDLTVIQPPGGGTNVANPIVYTEKYGVDSKLTGAYYRTDSKYNPFSHMQIKFAPIAKYANPKYEGTWKWDLTYGDIPIPLEFEFLSDVIAPTFDVIPSINGWTNGSINVYLRNINDDYSGIETFVNFDGTKSTNLGGRIVNEKYAYNNITTNIPNNGTYSFKMIDAAGNETTKTLVVNNIDKIEPTATLENTTTIKSTKNTLKFSNFKDDANGSGLKGVYLPNNTFVSGTEDVYYDVYERGYYTFGVQDNAGNVKYYSIKVENVYGEDKTPPNISFNPNTFTWSKDLKEIQVLIQDDNAFNAEYAWTNNLGDEKTYQPLSSNSVRQRTDKDRYLHIRATDFDENISEKTSEKIQVDLTAPTFELVYDDTKWVQQDLELLFTNFTDDNGSGVDYVILPDKNVVYNPTSVSYRVQENGVYFVEVADKVGNRKRVKIEAYNIDSKKPMVKVTQKDAGDNLKIINIYGKDE